MPDLFPTFRRMLSRRRGEAQAIVHPSFGGAYGGDSLAQVGVIGTLLPASDVDWTREVGDPALNYAVFGCLRWIADNLPEPTLQVVRRKRDGEADPLDKHRLLDLIETPNADYDGDSLLAATAWDYALTGRAYWLKERDQLGRVRELWWRPWWQVRPVWPRDGSQFLAGYHYYPDGQGKPKFYRKEDVVHFRFGLDAATSGRLGVHRTLPVLTMIATLNEGATYTASLLRNMGICPNLITTKGEVSPDTREALKAWFSSLFTRDGRGKPGVLDVEADLKQLGLSPEQLRLERILQRPELAVCSAFGIPPSVIYLGSIDGAKGFDNGGQHSEGRRAAYQDCLVPMTKRFAKTITRSLLPDFETAPPSKLFCRFDFTAVEALAEDTDALHARARDDYNGGILTLNEARELIGMPPVEEEAAEGVGRFGQDGATEEGEGEDDEGEDADDAF